MYSGPIKSSATAAVSVICCKPAGRAKISEPMFWTKGSIRLKSLAASNGLGRPEGTF